MKNVAYILLIASLLAASGCSGDPNKRKAKYFESGNAYFEKKQFREAAIEYSNAIQIDPSYVAARTALAKSHLQLGAFSSAAQEYARVLEIDPKNLDVQLEFGTLALLGGNPKLAQERADLILAADPGRTKAMTLRANALRQQGFGGAAVKYLEGVMAEHRRDAGLTLTMGVIQSEQNPKGAEPYLLRAIELDPANAAGYLAAAAHYVNQKRWPEAEAKLLQGISKQPANPNLRLQLARAYVAQSQLEKAEQALVDAKPALKGTPAAARMLGDFYLSTGMVEKAVDEFSALAAEQPSDAGIKNTLAQIYFGAKRPDDARRINQQVLKSHPGNVNALIQSAMLQSEVGDHQAAVQTLERAAQADPNNPAIQMQIAATSLALGQTKEAEAAARRSLRYAPDNRRAYLLLADLAVRRGDVRLMDESGVKLIELAPSSAAGYVVRGTANGLRRNNAAAEADFTKALSLEPKNIMAQHRLAVLKINSGRIAEGRKLLQSALSLNPDFSDGLDALATSYLATREPDLAVQAAQKGVAARPGNSNHYLVLAKVYGATGKASEDETALRKAIELDNKNVAALYRMGSLQASQNRVEEALATFIRLTEAAPGNPATHLAVAELQEKKSDFNAAEASYNKALQLQPEFPIAANNLAFLILKRGGDADRALGLAQVAKRGLPQSPEVSDTLGWAYYHKGIYGLAVEHLNEAVKRKPDNALYNLHLGLSYQRANQNDRARKYLERALQLDSTLEEGKRALAAVVNR